MGSISNDFSISLKPWPSKENDIANDLSTLIQRINNERGGFRDLTEESLLQEIAENEAAKEHGSSDEGEEEEEETGPVGVKDHLSAKFEMVAQLKLLFPDVL